MLLRPKTVSRFRPVTPPDPAIMAEHRKVVREINRRGILRGGLTLGALPLLTGCDVSDRDSVQRVLRSVNDFNDAVQAWLFNPNKLARTYDASLVVRPPRFNAHVNIEDIRPIDISTWKLELSGLIAQKAPWTIDQLYALPEQDLIIKHICVEGWDYIGQWSGPNLRQFLTREVQARLLIEALWFGRRCGDPHRGPGPHQAVQRAHWLQPPARLPEADRGAERPTRAGARTDPQRVAD